MYKWGEGTIKSYDGETIHCEEGIECTIRAALAPFQGERAGVRGFTLSQHMKLSLNHYGI